LNARSYLLLGILIAITLLVYLGTVRLTIAAWLTPEYAHGFLIFAISLYILWTKRRFLIGTPVKPGIPMGFACTVVGCLMLVIGSFGSILLLQQLSFIVTTLGLIWMVFGYAYVKILFLSLSYLVLAIPLFDEILGNWSMYFQLVAAVIATKLLRIFGMTVFQYAQFIELPHITLEVARICSGIQHIIAMVSLAIPLSYVTQKTMPRKMALVLLAFVMGILGNGLRVALIGLWTRSFGSASIHGPFSLLYSSSVFTLEFSILVLLGLITGKSHIREVVAKTGIPWRKWIAGDLPRSYSTAVALGLGVLLFAGGYRHVFKPEPVYLQKDLREIPLVIGGWKGREVERLGEDFEREFSPFELKRIYYDRVGGTVNVYVGYFAQQDQDQEIVSHRYDWLHDNAVEVQLAMKASTVDIKKTRYYDQGTWKFAYFWYVVGGRVMVDRYEVKLATIMDALTRRRTNAAIVIISAVRERQTPVEDREGAETGFVRSILPIIHDYVNST
jgi:EpsI family protein